MRRRQVVFGMIGTQLDAASGPGRWEKWRPTVSLGMHEDFQLDRIELLLDERRYARLGDTVAADLAQVSPETTVVRHDMHLVDPWDFEGVYACLHDFLRGYDFRPDEEDYLIHITTGTHVAQICWFLLRREPTVPGGGCCRPRRRRSSVAGRPAHGRRSTSTCRATTASRSASNSSASTIATCSRAASPRATPRSTG